VNEYIKEMEQNMKMELQAIAQLLRRCKKQVIAISKISSSMKMPRDFIVG